jgi:hypothetical protein
MDLLVQGYKQVAPNGAFNQLAFCFSAELDGF